MGESRKDSRGRGTARREGTDATPPTQHSKPFSSHSVGAADLQPAAPTPKTEHLALRPRGGIMTGGCPGDGVERGTVEVLGGLMSGAPQSTLIAILVEHRDALRMAKEAMEEALPLMRVEHRMDLAIAAAKIGYVLRGGVL